MGECWPFTTGGRNRNGVLSERCVASNHIQCVQVFVARCNEGPIGAGGQVVAVISFASVFEVFSSPFEVLVQCLKFLGHPEVFGMGGERSGERAQHTCALGSSDFPWARSTHAHPKAQILRPLAPRTFHPRQGETGPASRSRGIFAIPIGGFTIS